MSKYNIKCFAFENNQRMWEVTSEGRVWPCCNFSNAWDKRHNKDSNGNVNDESARLFNDKKIEKLLKDNPNWNHLEHNTLKEIINHDIYKTYIFKEGWESDNPPLLCKFNCCLTTSKK